MDAVGAAARCIELAGNPILAGYTASKLPWTRKHRPQVYAKLAKILLPHDYLNFWLTGQYFCEYGDASGTGWLDVRTRTWSQELLRATDPQRDLVRVPAAAGGRRRDLHHRRRHRRRTRLAARRSRGCGRGRQHDGRLRHRRGGPGQVVDEPGHFGHALRLFRRAGSRSRWRLGRLLLLVRRLDAADLHDELHRGDRIDRAPVRLQLARRRLPYRRQ